VWEPDDLHILTGKGSLAANTLLEESTIWEKFKIVKRDELPGYSRPLSEA
jgi:hypothetical protein